MANATREQLDRTREGYEDERRWHRFLCDAYSGGGGFEGRVRNPDTDLRLGSYGATALAVSTDTLGIPVTYPNEPGNLSGSTASYTYLEPYPSETPERFRRRAAAACYVNLIGPTTDLKISHIRRKPPTASDVPEGIEAWRAASAWSRGGIWIAAIRAAVLGWIPVVIDRPTVPRGLTVAQAQVQGISLEPTVTPLAPSELLDYDLDEAGFVYAKVRTESMVQPLGADGRPDPLSEPIKRTEWRIFERHRTRVWAHEGDEASDPELIDEVPNQAGRIPLVILRCRKHMTDPVKGLPMHAGAAKVAKKLFNEENELSEMLRGATFPQLVLAWYNSPKDKTENGEVKIGIGQAIPLDGNSTQKHYYLEPSGDSAEAYIKKIADTGAQLRALLQLDTTSQSSRERASGEALKRQFAAMNAQIASFAQNIAEAEGEIDAHLARLLGVGEIEHRYKAAESYDVADLSQILADTLDAQGLGLPPTAAKLAKAAVVKRLLPMASPTEEAQIQAELDEEADRAAQSSAFDDELRGDPGDDLDAEEADDDEDAEEREDAAA